MDNLHLLYDESFHCLLYANAIKIIDENNIIIDNQTRDYNYFKKLICTYVNYDFIKDCYNI